MPELLKHYGGKQVEEPVAEQIINFHNSDDFATILEQVGLQLHAKNRMSVGESVWKSPGNPCRPNGRAALAMLGL